jgi:hypothetical protein
MFSILKGTITNLQFAASMSSRPTSSEEFEKAEKTNTMTQLCAIAFVIAVG